MVFGDDLIGSDVILSRETVAILMSVTVAIGLVSFGFIFFLLISTVFGDVRGTIKTSEKALLYNVIVPDAVHTLFILLIICPATYTNNWPYSTFATNWLGYMFLWSIFHAPLAMASICNLMAMSYKTVSRYDDINRGAGMFVLSVSYACVSCCLCSLPATEEKGFVYSNFWFQPTPTVFHGYGGIFSMVANTGLALFIISKSMVDLFKVRATTPDKKVSKKYREDLNYAINFTGLCFTMSFILPLTLMIPIDNHVFAFVFRCVVYTGPILRVLLLTRTCPHFKFLVSHSGVEEELLSEFAQLGAAD